MSFFVVERFLPINWNKNYNFFNEFFSSWFSSLHLKLYIKIYKAILVEGLKCFHDIFLVQTAGAVEYTDYISAEG